MLPVVIDANILFSILISSEGQLASLLLTANQKLALFSPSFLFAEISRHSSRISSIAGVAESDLLDGIEVIKKWITVIPDSEIYFEDWQKAAQLVRDVDEDDTPYVACSLFLGIPLWTGDKKLREGLIAKGYQLVWSSDDVKQALDLDESKS